MTKAPIGNRDPGGQKLALPSGRGMNETEMEPLGEASARPPSKQESLFRRRIPGLLSGISSQVLMVNQKPQEKRSNSLSCSFSEGWILPLDKFNYPSQLMPVTITINVQYYYGFFKKKLSNCSKNWATTKASLNVSVLTLFSKGQNIYKERLFSWSPSQ